MQCKHHIMVGTCHRRLRNLFWRTGSDACYCVWLVSIGFLLKKSHVHGELAALAG